MFENIIMALCLIDLILLLSGKIGIEIWFIISAILSVIYNAFKKDDNELTKEELIELQKKIDKQFKQDK